VGGWKKIIEKTIAVSAFPRREGRMPAGKEQIGRTFLGLALRFGFRRTSVEDVARALGISKKTIYEHFRSKDQVLEYALELAALEQRRRVESALTETTALGRALQITRIALADAREGFARHPGVELVDQDIQAAVNDRVYGPMVLDLIEEGLEAGEFAVTDPARTSRFVMAVGMEAVRQIHDDPECRPEEATLEAIRRLIAGGMPASAAASPSVPEPAAGSGKKRKKAKKK
jgi:AcrR family transcriptional regulator